MNSTKPRAAAKPPERSKHAAPYISHVRGVVDKAALIFDCEEIETILHALNIAGAAFSDNEPSAVYDDVHDDLERLVFTND